MKSLISICFFVLLSLNCFAQPQTIQDVSKQIIPPSPTAASLGKYGGLPINYHTGGVTVSVPIHEVKIGSLSLPLSLSYQTSGIKVTDVASRVGLGWTLQGEGVVTRTIRGLPDEASQGWANYMANFVTWTEVNNVSDPSDIQVLELAAKGEVDCEPDMYSFNFMGHTGKFFVDADGSIVQLPYTNLKIEGGTMTNFVITGEDGTKYYFEQPESMQIDNGVGANLSYNSSWYLTRVLSLKNEEILFTYENPGTPITYGFTLSESDYYSYNGGGKVPTKTISQQTVWARRLQNIQTRTERVDFVYDAVQRQDLVGDYRLNSIRVYSKVSNEFFKQFDFAYTYSGSGSVEYKRLKLQSVTEHPYGLTEPKKVHSFVYNPLLLPPRTSFDQDHWGYFNEAYNSTLKPRLSFFPQSYPFGKRDTNPLKVGAESLIEIQYPTGGRTKFEFGVHGYIGQVLRDTLLSAAASISNAPVGHYSSVSFNLNTAQKISMNILYNYEAYDASGAAVTLLKNGSPFYVRTLYAVDEVNDGGYIQTPDIDLSPGNYTLIVENSGDTGNVTISAGFQYYNENLVTRTNYLGGLCLRSIADYDENNVLVNKTSLSYQGILNLQPMSQSNYYYQYTEVANPGGCAGTSQQFDYTTRTSSNNFSLSSSLGSHVAYSKVIATVEGISNGRTEYEYTTHGDLGSGAFFPFPPPTSREHRRGLLIREAQYNNSNALVRELINNYSFTGIDSLGAFKVGFHRFDECYNWSEGSVPNIANMTFGVYKVVSEWIKLNSTVERVYPGPVVSTTNIFYNNVSHLKPSKKETTRSDGKLAVEYMLYPNDYPDNAGFIKSLKDANVKQSVIEHVTAVSNSDGTGVFITGGKINTYFEQVNGKAGYQSNVKFLETVDPIPLASFKFSNRLQGVLPSAGSASAFSSFANYTDNIFYDSYDAYGNLLQFRTNQGIPVSLRWGYQSSRLIAMFEGATANQVFYQNFEDHAVSENPNAQTGGKYITGSHAVSFTRPDSKKYNLSYYKLNGSAWELNLSELTTNNPTVNPGMPIDNVLIYPSSCNFKLFSYHPKYLTVIDVTDNSYNTSYFSYDDLQRVELVKDYNKDITAFYNYHFRSQN